MPMTWVTVVGWIISACGISGITTFLVTRKITAIRARQEEQDIENSALKKGVQALLRANIIAIYNKYIEIGVIPIYERENLDHLYKEYKALGGNGVIEDLIEKLSVLPTPHKD